MIEARLFSSADFAVPTMLHVQPLWHFHPCGCIVNMKERARVHFTFRCWNQILGDVAKVRFGSEADMAWRPRCPLYPQKQTS
jgi:hypothetical protein